MSNCDKLINLIEQGNKKVENNLAKCCEETIKKIQEYYKEDAHTSLINNESERTQHRGNDKS